MFGYVLPSREKLTAEEEKDFQSIYCGLCRTLKTRYGFAAACILNYDFTVLAVLLTREETLNKCHRRCAAHPCRGCDAAVETEALRRSAAYSVILAWWQLQDKIADERGGKRIKARLAAFFLRRAYRRAAEDAPGFDERTRAQLQKLSALEKAQCPTLDEPADAFAELLAAVAEELSTATERRIFRELFYHLGRWIYLVDAADDLAADFRSGSYNPLIFRYSLAEPALPEETKKEFSLTLDLSVRAMAAAFELFDFGARTGLLRSIFYEGMYQVGNAVLAGTFRKATERKHGIRKETV